MDKARKKYKIVLTIDGVGILGFNSNMGMDGDWGEYENPFDATQFMIIGVEPDEATSSTVPKIYPNCEIELKVIFINENINYQFAIDHIKMGMVGFAEFEKATPREAWSYLFDLNKTDGAIGANGHYYLGQTHGADEFKIFTSSNINYESCNIAYSLRFSIKYCGRIKYCQIDPLMRTSSDLQARGGELK